MSKWANRLGTFTPKARQCGMSRGIFTCDASVSRPLVWRMRSWVRHFLQNGVVFFHSSFHDRKLVHDKQQMKLGLQVLRPFQNNRTPSAASACLRVSGQVWTWNFESHGAKQQTAAASQVPKDARAVAVAGIKGKSFEAGICHWEQGGSSSITAQPSPKSDL